MARVVIGVPSAAHPRSRGENRADKRSAPTAPGSSPLTRGKRVGGETDCSALGLIPAHAGKTGGGASLVWVSGAHPRSRGENARQARKRDRGRGSSPLTRGKREGQRVLRVVQRLIPAHAGKTQDATPCDP